MKKTIYTIIINFNGLVDTVKCLKTLSKLDDNSYTHKVVLADNGSLLEEFRNLSGIITKNYPWIHLIRSEKNLGFAKGNNLGIKYALDRGADYILLLNNDTEVEMNFLVNLLKLDYPISAPVVKFLEYANGKKLLYDMGGFVNWWTGRTWHQNVYEDQLNKFDKKELIVVDYVAGCAMLVKRQVWEAIGLLDEKYFIYFEDVDFCITAGKKGFKTIVDPHSFLYHKLGGSMDRWSNRAIYRNLTGNLIFILKHLGIRRVTGLFYIFILTLKIIRDRIKDYNNVEIRKWKGAKNTGKI